MESKGKLSRYGRAKNKVERIKEFHHHLTAYLLINAGLLMVKSNILDFFTANGPKTEGFVNWLDWNILATPVIWGIVLLFHGLYVFRRNSVSLKIGKPKALKDWEDRQIRKYMEEDQTNP